MLQRLAREGTLLRFSNFPALHGFSAKEAGNMSFRFGVMSEVEEKREALYDLLGVEGIVEIDPRHGSQISVVDFGDSSRRVPCDGLFTNERRLFLQLNPADCLPVFMVERCGKFVALIHAGRKSSDEGIMEKAVKLAGSLFMSSPENIWVAIGPGIQRCCDGNKRAIAEFQTKPKWQAHITRGPLGPRMDILNFAISRLIESGVPHGNISVSDLCTYCAKDISGNPLFFSHRRSIHTGELEGRFAALIALP